MNAVTAVRNPDPTPVMAAASNAVSAEAPAPSKENDQVFGPGLGILQLYMRMLNRLADDHHRKMKLHGGQATEAQKVVTDLDGLIAEINGEKENNNHIQRDIKKGSDAANFLKNNQKLFKGTEYEWVSAWVENHETAGVNRRQLSDMKGIIQKYATQESDKNSQIQLQVQKTMQTYQVTVGLMNSLQTMLGDMTKQFAQAIR